MSTINPGCKQCDKACHARFSDNLEQAKECTHYKIPRRKSQYEPRTITQSNLDYWDGDEELFVVRFDMSRQTIPIEITFVDDYKWGAYLVSVNYISRKEHDGGSMYDCRYKKF